MSEYCWIDDSSSESRLETEDGYKARVECMGYTWLVEVYYGEQPIWLSADEHTWPLRGDAAKGLAESVINSARCLAMEAK